MRDPDELVEAAQAARIPREAIKQRRCLDLWNEYGANFKDHVDFGNSLGPAHGFSGKDISKWMSRYPEFKAQMLSIEENRVLKKENESRAHTLGQERWPMLKRWKGTWVERYRETSSRIEACKLVGKTWKEVKEELESDAEFKKAAETVDEEFLVTIEDNMVKVAKESKVSTTAATNIIETQSERFSKIVARRKGAKGSTATLFDYEKADVLDRAKELAARFLEPPPKVNDVGDEPDTGLAAS